MPRLLFEKTGDTIFISHLDLMRLFQRSFKRAGLPLKHTQGFNPRPSVSIALPLSVGVESRCELLDFDLDGEMVSCDEICARLNAALIDGVRVLDVYEDGSKLKYLTLLDCAVELEYDKGVPENAVEKLHELFSREMLMVEKKGKNGTTQQDLIPMIKSMQIQKTDDNTVEILARICCQNPTLNPAQIPAAISLYLPECTPDFAKCRRIEVYDNDGKVFR